MKKNVFKRLTSWVLNVVMVMSLFAIFEPHITQIVSARVNGTKNFSNSYSLGDNPGQNMVNIAKAQLGKNGGSLGYSAEEWCADFVIDCAILANQSNAIPNKDENAICINLMNSIDKAGGYEVNAREAIAGDILFYGNSSRVYHVEIVYAQTGSNLNSLSTIGGNSGNSNNSLSQVKDHKTQSGMTPYKVFRPNYSGNIPPSNLSITTDKTSYKVGETINFSFTNSNASKVYVHIDANGKRVDPWADVTGKATYSCSFILTSIANIDEIWYNVKG